MSGARRRNRFGPPSILLGTAVLVSLAATPLANAAVGPAGLAGTAIAAPAMGCAPTPVAAARAANRSIAAAGATARVDDQLDGRGQLVGRQLAVRAANGVDSSIALPVESSVGTRTGDAIVYTRVVGGKSEIHLVDLSTGCDATLARPAGIARSAILDPAGASLYVHSVTAAGRRDAGVTRYALDGGGSELAVEALPDDARFGLTFGTQLTWSADRATLAVQSCGLDACRTRLLDVASGDVSMFDAPGQGTLVGVTNRHLVTLGDCPGLPCSVIAMDRASGSSQTLANEAWSASLAATEGGVFVVRMQTVAGIVEVEL